MYVKSIRITNSGPILEWQQEMPFDEAGDPAIVLIVGENGSGKTEILSTIADALMESAAKYFTDVLTPNGMGRNWFRVVGGGTTTTGQSGSFSAVRFVDGPHSYVYHQKSGHFTEVADANIAGVNWQDGNEKSTTVSSEDARRIFSVAPHLYFPAARFESPHWLNSASLASTRIAPPSKFSNQMRVPIYNETVLPSLTEWLSRVVLDSRIELKVAPDGSADIREPVQVHDLILLQNLDKVLQLILDDADAYFTWVRRGVGLCYATRGAKLPLNTLSTGQVFLLTLFGSILMAADQSGTSVAPPQALGGIVVVDEVDAHMHMDLITRAIPSLLLMFRSTQFIMSGHSPFLPLALSESRPDGLRILDARTGTAVDPESYSEFTKALQVVQKSEAFTTALDRVIAEKSSPLILCEGNTDPDHILHAAEVLGRSQWLKDAQVSEIGITDASGTKHGGEANIKSAWRALQNNPDMTNRPVLLLLDNDIHEPASDAEKASLRVLPPAVSNIVLDGIESYYPDSFLENQHLWSTVSINPKGGKRGAIEELNKREVHACAMKIQDKAIFEGFNAVLDLLDSWHSERVAGS